MEKQNNESPSPARSKKNTDTAHNRNKNKKEVSFRTYSAAVSPSVAEIAADNILPPSKLRMGSKFSTPNSSDAQDSSSAKEDTPQHADNPIDNNKLNIGPVQHNNHSSP